MSLATDVDSPPNAGHTLYRFSIVTIDYLIKIIKILL